MTHPLNCDPPPYPTASTTVSHLYQMLVQLAEWAARQMAGLDETTQAAVTKSAQEPFLPGVELLRAVSIWQLYRTVRSVRAIRINWDWFNRELQPGQPDYIQQVANSVAAARSTINNAFTTPSEFTAQAAAQTRAMSEWVKRVTGQDEGQQT